MIAAEGVLTRRFGARIALADPEELGGGGTATVLRVRVASTPFTLPRTLVIKRYPPQPQGAAADAFAKEAVSYQLFTALAEEDRMCPELIAHDGAERVLVLEDLGNAPTLADRLLGMDSKAGEYGLLSWARSLGRLHATTAGREADFDALMRRQDTPCGADPLLTVTDEAAVGMPELLERSLGVIGDALMDVPARTRWLIDASRHRAFSPSDICPDNNLITGKGVRFLDFEGGCVREALLDVGHLMMPFPSCWCSYALPPGLPEALLAVWRAEVTGVWPDLVDDDAVDGQLLDVRLFWVWVSTWLLLPRHGEQDRPVDRNLPSPLRGVTLAARWLSLAGEADRLGDDALAGFTAEVADALTVRFGSGLELFPAFR